MRINNFTHYKFEGWLPNDWEIKDAADVCIKITDGTHDTPKVVDSGVPFITAIHVKKGKIDFDNCLYISEEEHEKIYKRCNPSKGDLLVVNIGAGVAEYAFVETDKEFSLKNVALLKPNSDLLHDKYLCYHHAYKKENIAHRVKSGGAQPFLSLKELRKLKIVLPPLPEQQKIAKILSTWDKAISTTERLIDNSTQQKNALMQQLLTGKKRLLDESGMRFKGEWVKAKVRDLVKSLDAGVSVNSEDDSNLNSEYKILKTSCVSNEIFDPTKVKSVTEEIEITRLKEPVIADSIIISRMNTPILVGANGYVEHDIFNTFLPDRLWQIKPHKDNVIMKWLGYWFSSNPIRHLLRSTATGTSGSMKNITKSDVLNISITYPCLREQQKIATVLTNADREIELLEQQLADLKQEKKALMQVLLTGKKRVVVDGGV